MKRQMYFLCGARGSVRRPARKSQPSRKITCSANDPKSFRSRSRGILAMSPDFDICNKMRGKKKSGDQFLYTECLVCLSFGFFLFSCNFMADKNASGDGAKLISILCADRQTLSWIRIFCFFYWLLMVNKSCPVDSVEPMGSASVHLQGKTHRRPIE